MFLILGCGSIGARVAHLLREKGHDTVIIDKDAIRVEALREQNFDARVGNFLQIDLADIITTHSIEAALILTAQSEVVNPVIEKLHSIDQSIYVIGRAKDPRGLKELSTSNLDRIILDAEIVSDKIVREIEDMDNARRISKLREILKRAHDTKIGIFIHNNPDPDAIASALGLQMICASLDLESEIYYGGRIGHQENKAFVNLLEANLTQIEDVRDVDAILSDVSVIALLDSMVSGSNNILPENRIPDIIIDHHSPMQKEIQGEYVDIRTDIGATSTIITKYLQSMNISITSKIATALLFGIKTDTNDFTRKVSTSDFQTIAYLSPLADNGLIDKFRSPMMSVETLDIMGRAIQNREIRGSYLISSADIVINRDALPQAADFLLKLEGINTVLVFGIVKDVIDISARNKDDRIHIGEVLREAFGAQGSAGGHAAYAGAQVKLGLLGDVDDKETLVNLAKSAVRKQFFKVVGVELEQPVSETQQPPSTNGIKDAESTISNGTNGDSANGNGQ